MIATRQLYTQKGWSMSTSHPRTAAQVRAALHTLRQTAQRYDRLNNEGGEGYNPHAASLRTLEAEYDRLAEAEATAAYQARLAAEDAEWTREVTMERRAAWNAWVRSQGKSIAPAALAAHCQEMGYTMETLRRQITRHSL